MERDAPAAVAPGIRSQARPRRNFYWQTSLTPLQTFHTTV
jgi:hypothetical protein